MLVEEMLPMGLTLDAGTHNKRRGSKAMKVARSSCMLSPRYVFQQLLLPYEKPFIELKTAPADFRFPTTNQTRHCFSRYIEFHRCLAAKGEGSNQCERFAKYYRSLCPGEWIEKWNEQRENGTFPGPL
ncbi:hypothetical protein V6N11_069550 [Hibiscus sabdariffa]|uniref:Cytochrome c oxidase subunit n=1 Tax=Hibiscus sabdariffa TaxID=183260 RepID=A0ABR2Q3Q1_9ROSI